MDAPVLDIVNYLSGQAGLGTFGGSTDWSLYAFVEPNEPANCITLYDTGGDGPDTDDLDLANLTFQVRVRCETYNSGYAKHVIIRDLLIGVSPIVMDTSTFAGIVMSTDIAGIGRDENNRHVLTANYRAIRQI